MPEQMQLDFRQQRDDLLDQIEIEKARVELTALKRMRESWGTGDEWGWDDSTPPNLDTVTRPHYGARRLVRQQSSIYDRNEGRNLPFYETEWDLAHIRAQSRNLATFTGIALGAQEALANYVIGGEWKYKVEGKDKSIVEEVQKFLDSFLEVNDFVCDLDREIHDSTREDGEVLVALYPTGGGMSRAVRLEPEQLVEPANVRELNEWLDIDEETSWTFGVHTRFINEQAEDIARPLGYHVIFDDAGQDFDYLPSWPSQSFDDLRCATHFKRNVKRHAKRGVSDFWPLVQDIEREYKLSRNTAEGAAVQACIAYIISNAAGVSQSQIESSLAANAIGSYQLAKSSGGTKTVKVERFEPGSVVRIGKDQQHWAGPMGTLRSPVFIEVAQFLMRRIGIRWSMPEYMISGDSSNSNFASTLISESPFVKARQNDQKFFARKYRKLILKALKIAVDEGRFSSVSDFARLMSLVDITVEPTAVASRDPVTHAQANAILFDKGILDAETWAIQANLDPDKVTAPRMGGVDGFGPQSELGELSQIRAAMEHVTDPDEARELVRDIYP